MQKHSRHQTDTSDNANAIDNASDNTDTQGRAGRQTTRGSARAEMTGGEAVGLFDRVERKLDRVISGAFARAFKAEVQPVEIAAAMRRAMDERAAVVGKGRTMVPNVFLIELDPSDYQRLTMYRDVLTDELLASVEEHVESQRYLTNGPLHVDFARMDDLDTGVFRVRPTSSSAVPARRHGAGGSGGRAQSPQHRPRNLPYPPEATAAADGPVGMAGHAATAAAGAAAGTAAAGRAGDYMARHEVAREQEARQHEAREQEHEVRRDSGSDGDAGDRGHEQSPLARHEVADRHDAADPGRDQADHEGPDAADAGAGAGAAGVPAAAAPRGPRPPMRIYGDDASGSDWDAPAEREPAAPARPSRPRSRDAVRDEWRRTSDDDLWRGSDDDGAATELHQVAPSAPPLPDPSQRPWLDLDGDTYPLLSAISVIGRDATADITLDDPGVSRRHAEIRVTHDGPHLVVGLRDLGSTNGTYVNGERITSQRISDGDRVTVGRVSFTVRTRRR